MVSVEIIKAIKTDPAHLPQITTQRSLNLKMCPQFILSCQCLHFIIIMNCRSDQSKAGTCGLQQCFCSKQPLRWQTHFCFVLAQSLVLVHQRGDVHISAMMTAMLLKGSNLLSAIARTH